MGRKVILNLAMSLDGFIADEHGGYSWIKGDGCNAHDTAVKWDFKKFLDDVDVVVMGRCCYDQKMYEDYKDKKVLVASSELCGDEDNLSFISGDICAAVRRELEKDGKNIYLFGGGITLDSFLREDMIDEYVVGVIPTLLGKGRPLFLHGTPHIDLRLRDYYIDEGVMVLCYTRR